MKCETITGEWWYKDLKTGEDLPKYATPIIGLEEEPEILTRWQDHTIEEYKKEITRLNDKINKVIKFIKTNGEIIEAHEPEIIINKVELLNILESEVK